MPRIRSCANGAAIASAPSRSSTASSATSRWRPRSRRSTLEEKEQLIARKNAAIEELRQLEQQEAECQEQIRQHEEQLAILRSTFEAVTEAASKARVDVEAAAGNVNAIQREHENLSRIVVSLGARATSLLQEIESLARKRQETEAAVESSRSQLDDRSRKLHDLSEVRVEIEAEVADLQVRVQELETRAVASREQWNTAKDSLFESERRSDRATSAFDLLREQIALDLHAGIDALAEVEPPADDEGRAALEAEVAKLDRSDREDRPGQRAGHRRASGARAARVVPAHAARRSRAGDRVAAQHDPQDQPHLARAVPRRVQRASTNTSREIFISLFGGGTARMQLLDEEDVLESGIELVAQPPGKKNQSIALLSGGERALTAMALLFAIFRYKPSPFCILDEVDAPLDEVNNERFVRLVRDMSRDTQFIVITHSAARWKRPTCSTA